MKNLIFAAMVASAIPAIAGDFAVTSPDIKEGMPINPAQYWNNFGCSGENARPSLSWSGAPAGTKSFAVTLYDRDAPTGSGFWHWVVFNIPSKDLGISSGEIPTGAVEGNTDVGKPGYIGPCPPVGRTHNYTFTVHALDTETLGAPEGATAALTGFFIYQHTLATATLNIKAGPRKN